MLVEFSENESDIRCGPFGTQLSKDEYKTEGVALWGIPQINTKFKINPTDFLSEKKAKQLEAYSIISGDIVMSRKENVEKNGINYNGVEIEKFNPFYGRVLIKYHKQFQSQCRYVADIFVDFEVLQILPSVFEGDDFPGYDNVRLSFRQLETIVNRHKRDWVAALENQKAIYLIRDSNNCKLYDGSVTGDNGMLLQRWKNYTKNGHGSNKELFEIVLSNGFDYIKENFQYSILENYNAKVANEFILKRETWWKETLGTRNPMSGYKCN